MRWSLLSDTHWPRVARPPPRSRDSASSTAASPRSAKRRGTDPPLRLPPSAAAAIANTFAPPTSAAPRAARPRPACTLRPSAKRRSARPRTRRARATRGDRFKDAAARHGTSSRAERELVPLQRRRRAHGHDQRPAADVAARRTLPRCALTCTRPSVRCRTGTEDEHRCGMWDRTKSLPKGKSFQNRHTLVAYNKTGGSASLWIKNSSAQRMSIQPTFDP